MKFKFLNAAFVSVILSVSGLANVANANIITIDFDVNVTDTNNALASWQSRDDLFLSIVIDTELASKWTDHNTGIEYTHTSSEYYGEDSYRNSQNDSIVSYSSNILDSFSNPDCTIDWGNCQAMAYVRNDLSYAYDPITGSYTDIVEYGYNSMGFNVGGWSTAYMESYLDEWSTTPWSWETLQAGQQMFAFYNDYYGDVYNACSRSWGCRDYQSYNNFETLLTINKISVVANEVPEPSTLAIFALGMIGLASRRFKKQS
jgi:hypothetical protein